MIKKFYVSAVFLAVFCISATVLFAQEENPEAALPGFQLLLSGEIGYANNSDMSDYSKAYGDYIADEYNDIAASQSNPQTFRAEETSSPNSNFGFDVELRFFPASWGLGFGTGVHMAESVVEVKGVGYSNEIEYSTTLVVIPVVATLYYLKPINSWSFLTFGAGVGKYFAFIDGIASSNDTVLHTLGVYEPSSEVESAIGFNLKAEYTLYFRPFCLTAGIVGRYVEFGEFKDLVDTRPMTEAGLTGVSLYLAAGLAI